MIWNSQSLEEKTLNSVVVIRAGGLSGPVGHDPKLLAALPVAKRVLEISPQHSDLGAKYTQKHPQAVWLLANPNIAALATVEGLFDLVVMSAGLPIPEVLHSVSIRVARGGILVVGIDNAASWASLAQVIEGDVDAVDTPLSPASAYKRLLDAGWMPTLADQHVGLPPSDALAAATAPLADALSVPRRTADRTLGMARAIVQAVRGFDDAPRRAGQALFSVVVPTTRETQLRANVERSPGLQEVNAQVISYRGASSPAEALSQSLVHCDGDWVLFCHQDVYFPRGFGEQLNAVLGEVPADARASALFGFIGMGVNRTTRACEPAGFVIDRLHRASHADSDSALSIDELAIVVARESVHRIDPALGWHLWATDLCLTAVYTHGVFPRILRLPVFHNSSNDYVLPSAFQNAAAILRRKHPKVGTIHKLCGTIAEAFLAPQTQPGCGCAPQQPIADSKSNVVADLNLELEEADRQTVILIAQKRFSEALATLAKAVNTSYLLNGVAHHKLYYPRLDRRIEQLAANLEVTDLELNPELSGRHVIIATELYQIGGHSKVIEDLSHELEGSVILLTDLFDTYHNNPSQLGWMHERFKHAEVVTVPRTTLWKKCEAIQVFVRSLNPLSISHFGHHQDPLPYVATLGIPFTKQIFFHHGDHNPSLGCTLRRLHHVDLSPKLVTVCTEGIDRPVDLLPMYVKDLGVRSNKIVMNNNFSVVTSGRPAKYTRTGPNSLQEVVLAALLSIHGNFFHIGPLDDGWISDIRAHLYLNNVDQERFVYRGQVSSVWAELLELDASFYIGSAPVGGGRAAVEAQGCGLPVLFFDGFNTGPLVENFSLFGDLSLHWSSTGELASLLRSIGNNHASLSVQARSYYMKHFSRQRFQYSLKSILSR